MKQIPIDFYFFLDSRKGTNLDRTNGHGTGSSASLRSSVNNDTSSENVCGETRRERGETQDTKNQRKNFR
jgi:hypothetical protein